MKKQFINATVALSSILLLNACGGGGGDSGSSASSSAPATTTPSSPAVSTPTTTVKSTTTTPTNLTITDSSGVSGLKVKCGSKNLTTNAAGGVDCTTSISVYLGNFKLGEVKNIPADGYIFTQDILGVTRGAIANPEVTKVSMILQSLDEDAQALNGITLNAETLDLLGSHLSYSTKLTELSFEDVEYIINDVIETKKSQDENSKLNAVNYNTAQSNLATATAGAPALTYTQRSVGRI